MEKARLGERAAIIRSPLASSTRRPHGDPIEGPGILVAGNSRICQAPSTRRTELQWPGFSLLRRTDAHPALVSRSTPRRLRVLARRMAF